MNWTKEKPTEPGWYWMRSAPPGIEPTASTIVQVYMNESVLSVKTQTDRAPLSNVHEVYQFAGPIPEPEGGE